jgi:deazaflavin-dependent oxidoreductase (nitroreductase family)
MQKLQFSSNGVKLLDFGLAFVQGRTVMALLTTKGRKTGKEHSVLLRAVLYEDKIYFSRRNQNSDWLKNAIANSAVKVEFDGKVHVGTASVVLDETLAKKISALKYPGEKRAEDVRVVLQVELKQ